MLKPKIGTPDAVPAYRLFWLLFASLDLVSMVGLILFNTYFANESPGANNAARRIMAGIYISLVIVGGWFFVTSFKGASIAYKVLVQSAIMLLIGIGGIIISIKHRADTAVDRQS